MKVSCRWLSDYVDYPWPAQQLAEKLTAAGLEVDAVERLDQGLEDIVVGEIVSVEPHPNADKLVVTRVNVGSKELQIVTGAPNVTVGAKVPVAEAGSTLPSGMEIKKVKLRGLPSEGMMCSEAELGVGDDHSGIMILPTSTPIGQPLAQTLGLDDTVIDFEVYPNRPDLQCIIGVAREVSALTGNSLRMPETSVSEGDEDVNSLASVEIDDIDLCPRYTARVVKGIKIGPSPQWMQDRLRAAGMRPINNIVDITNFVMLELGQPLHAFDYDLLESKRIIVRRAKDGEKITTLDGVERTLSSDTLLITDGGKPVAIAGIMGGENSEVQDSTTTVLIESANFSGPNIRRTARALGLRTESSQRFEKRLDPNLTRLALDRAAALMAQLGGGTVARGVIDVNAGPVTSWKVSLRPSRVKAVLGVDVPSDTVVDILTRLDLKVEEAEGILQVTIPTYRTDLMREIDLIEEIARIYGYDQIPVTLPGGKTVRGGKEEKADKLDRVRESLISLGLMEAITYSFVSPKGFDKIGLPKEHPLRQAIPIRNPLTEEQSIMRTTLLPGLLQLAASNAAKQVEDVAVFELGAVYKPKKLPLTEQPDEEPTLGIALMGGKPGCAWTRTPIDFYDLKGLLDGMAWELGLSFTWEAGTHPSMHPGRTARIVCNGTTIGFAGEVHPDVLEAYGLANPVYVTEVILTPVMASIGRLSQFERLPRYPAIRRDLALLASKDVSAVQIEQTILNQGGELVREVRLFDVYEGKQVPEGYRSLAYSIIYRADDRTLTDEVVKEVENRVKKALVEKLGVELRG